MDAESGWCIGCLRSIDEIVAWASLDDAAKRAVLSRLRQRRQQRAAERAGPSAGNKAVP